MVGIFSAHQAISLIIPPPLVLDPENSGRSPDLSAYVSPSKAVFSTWHVTMYSKPGLLCQLVQSLEMTYVLRELFEIPGGDGRILNIDESMTYRHDLDEKTWTY